MISEQCSLLYPRAFPDRIEVKEKDGEKPTLLLTDSWSIPRRKPSCETEGCATHEHQFAFQPQVRWENRGRGPSRRLLHRKTFSQVLGCTPA
jgi:hypothetical protein